MPNAPGSKKRRRLKEAQEDDEEGDDGYEDAESARLRKRMEAAMAEAGDDSDLDDEDDGEGDDSETARLRRRMQGVMDDAGDESDLEGEELDGDKDIDDEEYGDDKDMDSFHNASGDDEYGDLDEDDEEDDDGSETLEEGPIDERTRRMREKMHEMMEAAERRALGEKKSSKADAQPKSILKSSGPQESPVTPNESRVPEDEDGAYDLTPLHGSAKPLSTKVLKAAAKAEEERKLKEDARMAEAMRKREEKERLEKKEMMRKKAKKEKEGGHLHQIS